MANKIFSILFGLFLTALGIKLLTLHMLTFGGTAGIATILTLLFPISWGLLFFLVNLPFFLISFQQMGKWFTISSFVSIIGISVIRDALDMIVPAFTFNPVIAAAVAGLFIGVGVSLVLNNGSSLGGIHILALFLDKKLGLNRGLCIFIFDLLILIAAIFLVGLQNAIVSTISIVIASYIIGRYKTSPIPEVEVSTDVQLQDA